MATKYPKAKWRPISRNFTNKRRKKTRGIPSIGSPDHRVT